jgi:hypothetical protein
MDKRFTGVKCDASVSISLARFDYYSFLQFQQNLFSL